MLLDILSVVIVLIGIVLLLQSVASLGQTLYIWNRPDRARRAARPVTLEAPRHGFTVLLPARHEHLVIGETLRRLGEADYPRELVELLVICTADDVLTIAAAEDAKERYGLEHVTIAVFDGEPGKSRAMNFGLANARHDLLTIFDSEDDVSPDLFSIANTLFTRRDIDVLQCGVQLMDFSSHWFAAHNVLEYFFWFKSRMHYFAQRDAVPLGGNSVFFRVDDLRAIGGWDEHGLTEDADVGIRLSVAGKRFDVMYDAAHVTREEVPHSTRSFVKQRTRWNQGFVQILRKKDWLQLRKPSQVLLVGYVLSAPTYMALVIAFAPGLMIIGATVKLPVLISLFSFIPLILAVLTLAVSVVGLFEFGRDQNVVIRPHHVLLLIATFVPYQGLLLVSAVRAVIREYRGDRGWEKTAHTGRHRLESQVLQPVPIAPVRSIVPEASEAR